MATPIDPQSLHALALWKQDWGKSWYQKLGGPSLVKIGDHLEYRKVSLREWFFGKSEGSLKSICQFLAKKNTAVEGLSEKIRNFNDSTFRKSNRVDSKVLETIQDIETVHKVVKQSKAPPDLLQ